MINDNKQIFHNNEDLDYFDDYYPIRDDGKLYEIDKLNLNDSTRMYFEEVSKYPLLSFEEEQLYGKMLQKPEKKKLLLFKDVDGYSNPNLNVPLLFCSLQNCLSYDMIINNLISFYGKLNSNNNSVVDMLKRYKIETKKVKRSLNYAELRRLFNITYNGSNSLLSEKELLMELKEFMNYQFAFDKMFVSNLRLVISIASDACSKFRNNADLMDLINEGNFGLMKAIEKFDVTLGNKFSTYATYWIRQRIRRAIVTQNTAVKIPEYVTNNIAAFKRRLSELEQQEKKTLSIEEIAQKLSMPIDLVLEYQKHMGEGISLDENIGEDDLTIKNIIPSDDNVEEEVFRKSLKTDIQSLLDVLNERELKVIEMYYGLGEYSGKTYSLSDIAKELNVSPQRARQIEVKALYKMKRCAKLNEEQGALRDYLR